MTSRNFHWNDAVIFHAPFLLKPCGKDYLWGGSRLKDDFSKEIDLAPLAETWECSTHPDGPSLIASGEHAGKTLREVLRCHPEYLGSHPLSKEELPILIKFIDAKEDLSVQVHPDDRYAKEKENGQSGKTEMWYILDAAKDAKLVYGLHHDSDKDRIRQSIENGAIEKYLQKIPVKKDDVFYIEAGTVHAIGAGILAAEIQENSNLTYRLYDYGRVDQHGNQRRLHVEKALEVASLRSSQEPRQPMRVLRYRQGCATELLCRCKYFEVHRMLVNTERCRQLAVYQTDGTSFHVLLCIKGCGSIYYGEEKSIRFFKGDCIFVPVHSVEIRIHADAQFLDVRS